jgi:hypothetical protein
MQSKCVSEKRTFLLTGSETRVRSSPHLVAFADETKKTTVASFRYLFQLAIDESNIEQMCFTGKLRDRWSILGWYRTRFPPMEGLAAAARDQQPPELEMEEECLPMLNFTRRQGATSILQTRIVQERRRRCARSRLTSLSEEGCWLRWFPPLTER